MIFLARFAHAIREIAIFDRQTTIQTSIWRTGCYFFEINFLRFLLDGYFNGRFMDGTAAFRSTTQIAWFSFNYFASDHIHIFIWQSLSIFYIGLTNVCVGMLFAILWCKLRRNAIRFIGQYCWH